MLATIANVNRNHWIALILDFNEAKILYGDSLGGQISAELRDILGWWTYLHSGKNFSYAQLPTTQQEDGYSCGLLTWNALAAFLLKSIALMDPRHVVEERLKVLLRVVERHNDLVRHFN